MINKYDLKEFKDEMYAKELVDFYMSVLGLYHFKVAISYLCENYQIEKNIIRNRRDTLEDLPERQILVLDGF